MDKKYPRKYLHFTQLREFCEIKPVVLSFITFSLQLRTTNGAPFHRSATQANLI